MPLESYENLQRIIDLAVSVLSLIALIFVIALMFKIWDVCVKALEVFNFFTLYRSAIRELMIQIERFCRRYANIADSENSIGDIEKPNGR